MASFATYRARGAIRELGKALGLPAGGARAARAPPEGSPRRVAEELAQLPGAETRPPRRAGGPSASSAPRSAVCRGTSPSTRAAWSSPAARCRARAAAARRDGGAQALPVGQGLLRRRRLPEDRPARARHALRGRGVRRPDRPPARRAHRPLAHPARRPRGLRGDPGGRHRRLFQIESRAQMQSSCARGRRTSTTSPCEVALVRPGPIQGGAVHPYVERRQRRREDPGYVIPHDHPLLAECARGDARRDRLPGPGARRGRWRSRASPWARQRGCAAR